MPRLDIWNSRMRSAAVCIALLTAANSWTPAAHAQPLQYLAPYLCYDAGISSTGMASGDFNGDGHLDLALINYSSSKLRIVLSAADGSYIAGAQYATDDNPRGLAVGDVNGDGILDIVTANCNTNANKDLSSTCSVFLGNGDGTFAARVDWFWGVINGVATPWVGQASVAIGDMDNDGVPDLVIGLTYTNHVAWVRGLGGGQFATPVTIANFAQPYQFAIADLDGNGTRDIVCGSIAQSNATVLLTDGHGAVTRFSTYPTGANPQSPILRDFNGDGLLDMAFANAASSTVTLWRGASNGSFVGHSDFTMDVGPTSVVSADVNGDGRLDLISANTANTIAVRLALAAGGFGAATLSRLPGSPAGLATDDVNADGHLDVLTSLTNSPTVTALLGNGDGSIGGSAQEFGTAPSADGARLADFDRDGRSDLLASAGTGTFWLHHGNGDGTFAPGNQITTGQSANGLALEDFDGDGSPDIVTVGWLSFGFTILLCHGDGTFGSPTSYDLGWYHSPGCVAVGDVNGDEIPDVITGIVLLDPFQYNFPSFQVNLGHGDGTFGPTSIVSSISPDAIAVADMNGDGHRDVVLIGNGAALYMHFGNGDGTFGPPVVVTLPSVPGQLAVQDLDGDGATDVVLTNSSGTGLVTVLYGHNDGTFEAPLSLPGFSAVVPGILLGDVDGDHRCDITLSDGPSGAVSVYLATSPRGFSERTEYGVGLNPTSAALGDVTGDGRPDIVSVDMSRSTATVLWHSAATPVGIRGGDAPPPAAVHWSVVHAPVRTVAEFRATGAVAGDVTLQIHDVRGRLVRALTVPRAALGATPTIRWDLHDATGQRAPAGLYLATLKTTATKTTLPLLILR